MKKAILILFLAAFAVVAAAQAVLATCARFAVRAVCAGDSYYRF